MLIADGNQSSLAINTLGFLNILIAFSISFNLFSNTSCFLRADIVSNTMGILSMENEEEYICNEKFDDIDEEAKS